MPERFEPARCGLMIGATKCATTSLYRALSAHPHICPSSTKELNLFLTEATSPATPEAYLEHFRANPLIHRVTLEASPQSSHFPRFEGVAERMAACGAPFKLIYIVRDPFERLESHYRNGLGEGFLDAGPGDWLDEYGVLASDYALQLEQFERCFAREDILVLSFDLVTQAPQLAHDRICSHLGIPGRLHLSQGRENRGESFVLERAREHDGDARSSLAAARREAELPRDLRAELKARWQPGMSRLARDYGIDVTRWGFRAPEISASTAAPQAVTTQIDPIALPSGWRPGADPFHDPKQLAQPFHTARETWAAGDLMRGRIYGARAERVPVPKYSLIIASHGRPDSLQNLLEKLRPVRQSSRNCEVFVVLDGADGHDYSDLAARYSDVALVFQLSENAGPGTARNAGAARASGDFLVFIDDDCEPEPGHLDHLSERLRRHPNIHAMGGPTRGLTGSKRGFLERFTLRAGLNPAPGYHKGRLICLPSCNLAVRRDWFLSLGGFDPALRASEDYNLTYRLKAAGAHLHDDPHWVLPHDQSWRLGALLKRAHRDGYWLSRHMALTGDRMARDILPRPKLAALWQDLPSTLGWRFRSWQSQELSRADRLRFAMLETLRQVWRLRGCRQWARQEKKAGQGKYGFEPDRFEREDQARAV